MSVDDDSLIECCLIFDGPEFFNTLSPKQTFAASFPGLASAQIIGGGAVEVAYNLQPIDTIMAQCKS